MHQEIDGFGDLKRPKVDPLLTKAKKCLYLAMCYAVAVDTESKNGRPALRFTTIENIANSAYVRFLEHHEELLGHQIIAIEDAFSMALKQWIPQGQKPWDSVPLEGLGRALFPESFR